MTRGGFVICRDKASFDRKAARRKIVASQKRDYYKATRGWSYKDIKPRIIAERYEDSLGKPESVEYKVTCFNGKVEFITICKGIAHSALSNRTNDHYDINFNRQNWYAFYKNSNENIPKPKQWEKLIELSETLAGEIPYVRVDWYVIEDRIYFGEMTFYTWGGFIEFNPKEQDKILGERLTIPLDNLK